MLYTALLSVLVVVVVTAQDTTEANTTPGEFWPGKDCPVDKDIGLDDPNNVFSCKVEETCCTKNLKPACCAEKPMDEAIQEQVALWGTLLGIILVMGLFIWFCRSDQSLLDGETPCLHKFCSCCGWKKRGDDGHLHDKSDGFGSEVSLQSSKSTVLLIPEEDEEGVLVEDDAANLEAVLEPEEAEEENDDAEESNEAGNEEEETTEYILNPSGERGIPDTYNTKYMEFHQVGTTDYYRKGKPYKIMRNPGSSIISFNFNTSIERLSSVTISLNHCRTTGDGVVCLTVNGRPAEQKQNGGFGKMVIMAPRFNFGWESFDVSMDLLQDGINKITLLLDSTSPGVYWLSDVKIQKVFS